MSSSSQSGYSSQSSGTLGAYEATPEKSTKVIVRSFYEYQAPTNGRPRVYDSTEWDIVDQDEVMVYVTMPGQDRPVTPSLPVATEQLLPASEQDMTSFKVLNLPWVVGRELWRFVLPGQRVIRLHEGRPLPALALANQGLPPGTGPGLVSPRVTFYHGKKISITESFVAIWQIGSLILRNIYTTLDLKIPAPRGAPGFNSRLTIDTTKDTIVIEIRGTSIPAYVYHLDLSPIKHLAIEFQTSVPINARMSLPVRAITAWTVAALFPNLETLTVILGSTGSSRRPKNSQFKLIEIDDSFLEIDATFPAQGYQVLNRSLLWNSGNNIADMRIWTGTASFYRENYRQSIRAMPEFATLFTRRVRLEVSMVAWFHGSSMKPRETTRLWLQPKGIVQYSNVAFYTYVPVEPVDIERTVGKKSKHFLTFEEHGIVARATPRGDLKMSGIDMLEDIRSLFV